MGLSCGEVDLDNDKERSNGVVGLIEKRRECSEKNSDHIMDIHHHNHHHHHDAVEFDFQFWPIEHPVEPQDEDRPVKCPIPNSSVINDGGMYEEKYVESLRKRAEVPEGGLKNEGINVIMGGKPLVGAVRKRHHMLTHGDRLVLPSTRMSPRRPSISNQNNVTIFQTLQDFDKFEY